MQSTTKQSQKGTRIPNAARYGRKVKTTVIQLSADQGKKTTALDAHADKYIEEPTPFTIGALVDQEKGDAPSCYLIKAHRGFGRKPRAAVRGKALDASRRRGCPLTPYTTTGHGGGPRTVEGHAHHVRRDQRRRADMAAHTEKTTALHSAGESRP